MLLVTETSQMCNACITLLIRFLRSGNRTDRRLTGSMTVRADRIDRTGFLLLSKNFVLSGSP